MGNQNMKAAGEDGGAALAPRLADDMGTNGVVNEVWVWQGEAGGCRADRVPGCREDPVRGGCDAEVVGGHKGRRLGF